MKLTENGTPYPSSASQYGNEQQGLESPSANAGSRANMTQGFIDRTDLDAQGSIDRLRREMAGRDRSLAIDLAAERLGSQKQVSGAAIALQSESAMMCVASVGSAPPVGTPLDLKSGLSADCIRTCKPIYCEDTSSDSRVDPAVCEMLQIRSVLIVPVFSSMRVIGLVEVFSPVPHNFTSEQRARVQEVAALVADTVRPQRQIVLDDDVDDEPRVEEHSAPTLKIVADNKQQTALQDSASQLDQIRALFVPVPEPAKKAAEKNVETSGSILERLKSRNAMLGILAAIVLLVVGMLVWRGSHRHTVAVQTAAEGAAATQTFADKPPAGSTPADTSQIAKGAPGTKDARASNKAEANAAGSLTPTANAAASEPLVPAKSSGNNFREADSTPPPTDQLQPQTTSIALPKDVLSAGQANVTLQAPAVVPVKTSNRSGGKLIRKVTPIYPPNARAIGIAGSVRLLATVGKQGNVEKVKIISGPAMLTGAAEQAVRQWKYEPFLVNGTPTPNEVQVDVAFH